MFFGSPNVCLSAVWSRLCPPEVNNWKLFCLRCRDWKTKQRPDLANQFVYYSVYMCERYRYMYV